MHEEPLTQPKYKLPWTLIQLRCEVPLAGTPQLEQSGPANRSPFITMLKATRMASLTVGHKHENLGPRRK